MVSEKVNPLVGILTGPTASGKTQLALRWASELANIEIINADSLLVYRGLDIGTAKPTQEQLGQLPHHLIDILNPNEAFTAGDFFRAAQAAITEIHNRGKRALIIGGTGFYLKALLFGIWGLWETPAIPIQDAELKAQLQLISNVNLYEELLQRDPTSAGRIGLNDRYRLIRAIEICRLSGKSPTELQASIPKAPDPRFKLWIIDRENSELYVRIRHRTQDMLNNGVIEEFQTVMSRFPQSRALMAVGYAQIDAYLKGNPPSGRKLKPGLEGLFEEIQLATRQLVKRQRTWFKGQCPPSMGAQWFKLDDEIDLLRSEFQKVYG